MRPVALFAIPLLLIAACGGGAQPTAAPTLTAAPTASAPAPSATAASSATSGATSPEALCGLLTAADWQQFNYVTGARPTVTSDAPGTAICQYASKLFLEVYTDASETDAEATYQTILENVPFDEPQALNIPGAAVVTFDPDIGEDHAGIAVRAGRLSFLVTGLARDSVQAELTTLATLVLTRSPALQ